MLWVFFVCLSAGFVSFDSLPIEDLLAPENAQDMSTLLYATTALAAVASQTYFNKFTVVYGQGNGACSYDQTITGVGFQATALFFWFRHSIFWTRMMGPFAGACDSSLNQWGTSIDTYNVQYSTTYSILFKDNTNGYIFAGKITSINTDGFVVHYDYCWNDDYDVVFLALK